MSPQVPKSATTIDSAVPNPDSSIPSRASTTLRLQSIAYSAGDGDEGYPGIAVPEKTPATMHSSKDIDAQRREDSRTSVSVEARNEDYHSGPIQMAIPLVTPGHPFIDRGDAAVQNREAGHGVDAGFSIPRGALTIATELSVDRGDRGEGSFITEASNTSNQILPTPKFEVAGVHFESAHFTGGGHAFGNNNIVNNTFMSGDGQFTKIERNLICDYIAKLAVLPEISVHLKEHVLTQSITSLPRAEAVFNDYQTKKKSGPCFGGTRVALLREMADWVTGPDESRMYVLSGLAGIGKSTVAYTIASRAADLNFLGASFFFSRDEADRNNAKKFFTTIAFQLCVYNETFSKAIGDALKTERGAAATTKDPQNQLHFLILDPLRSIVQSRARPILVVVDALDECDDEDDERAVIRGLSQLVRELPFFKVILTTRPQPHLDRFLCIQGGHKIFRLQDIENKVVDGDIRLYLKYSLSLEAVQERYPQRQWCASGEEVDTLVGAAGRLFIIASTAVRYIFDKSASNPAAQMQKLLRAFARYLTPGTPFKDLDQFYTVILRNVVPENCNNDDTVRRYQSVVGAIVFVQRPLPILTLAQLIDIDVVEIRVVLDNLQSVILLGSDDVPRIYHKSFPDYLTDQARCKDPCLQIDTRIGHIQIATRCFEIMNKRLKRNILGLGDPARFMSNEDGLKEDGITDEQIQEKIPQQLCYACVYWVNHLQVAKIEDEALMNGLEKFVDEHMLYWFEVLSLIGNLDSSQLAIRVVLELLKSRSSDLHQLLSDALRFIGKFYDLIKRSALHTYYSALPFTPSNTLLYRRYIKDAVDNLCSIEGEPEKWDVLVANIAHGYRVDMIKFSLASTLFFSCSQRVRNMSKICDAVTGTPISTVPGERFAVANDFSTVASSRDKTITFYNVNGSALGTMFTTSSMIKNLALSSENSLIAAALADGTVWLWDSENAELVDSFDGFQYNGDCSWLEFSSTGTRLAYSSANGIKLRDGISGRFVADLPLCGLNYMFSDDGSRIASLSRDDGLTLWNSESGELIGAVRNGGHIGDVRKVGRDSLAITANGSLLATTDRTGMEYKPRLPAQIELWSENRDHLTRIKVLKVEGPELMAFSLDNILAITTNWGVLKLYNLKTHTFISTLPFGATTVTSITFSPDCTRLAVGTSASIGNSLRLLDIRGIKASSPPSKGNATVVTALALSQDCSRLACGFENGTVELWETSPTKRRIGHSKMKAIFFRIFRQFRHAKSVQALGFDPDGKLFASGSDDGTIKLWNGRNGALHSRTLKTPRVVQAVALSDSVLVAVGGGDVTLWSLGTLRPIHTFKDSGFKLSIANNSALIAISGFQVVLFDAVNCTTIAKFDVPSPCVHTMTFLPDNSQLMVQSFEGLLQSLSPITKGIIHGPTLEHLIQLPNIPLWQGVPIWHCQEEQDFVDRRMPQHYFSALFSQHTSPVPVLWIPRENRVTTWTQGSSMVALSCEDGHVTIVRLPTSHIS